MHVCCSTFRDGHIQYLAGINIFVMAQIVGVHYIDDRITYVVAVGSRLGGDLPKRVTLTDLNCYIFFVRITDPTELRQGRNQYYRHKNKANGAVCMIFFRIFLFILLHSSAPMKTNVPRTFVLLTFLLYRRTFVLSRNKETNVCFLIGYCL